MKKIYVQATIALHPVQAKLVELFKGNKIDLESDTLREIAKKIHLEKEALQQIKHHIGQLVKLGLLDIVGGKYIYHG